MTDKPAVTAFDHAAPAGERYDANAELQRVYRPLASSLLPQDAVRDVIGFIENGLADQAMAAEQMAKAARGADVIPLFPGRMEHSPQARKGEGMRSVYIDKLQIFVQGDYFDKPSPVGFEALRSMVEGTPILNSIILTRLRQLSRFCAPSEDGGPGFEIRHIDRKHKLTEEEQQSCRLLSRFMQNCGWETNARARKRMRRDTFRAFMLKVYRDSLTMDAAPIETEMKRNRDLGMDGFYAVDGATVRLCTEEGYEGNDAIFALQVIQGRLATAYDHDGLVYEVRNPRSDVRLAGYGMGEPELLIRVVTGFLNAMNHNIAGFDKNSIPRGVLHLTGNYSSEDLAAFKRYWNATVRGVNNAWALPVMVSQDQESKVGFENFGVQFDEMMFSKWMTFLTSICCAIYGMDPTEINFESFASQKSSLSGDDTEERLANSKDSGLHPDMAHFEGVLTDFFVSEFNPNLCFRFTGQRAEDEKWRQEVAKTALTVDELRAENGYDAYPGDYGSAPVNPTMFSDWSQQRMMSQQPKQEDEQADFGQPEDSADGAGGADEQQADAGQPDASGGQSAPEGEPPGKFGGAPTGEFGKSFMAFKIGDKE